MKTINNIDNEELKKFSSIAHNWWDKSGDFKLLHDINPTRLSYIKKLTPLKGKKVLDIGCGGGILAEAMAKQGAIVTGIDASQENIDIANEHSKKSGLSITYIKQTAEEISKQALKYELIICMELLEHVPKPESIIYSCAKILKKEGQVFFSTINRNIKSYILTVLTAEYLLKLLPKGTHNYEKFIRPSELVYWGQQYGLTVNDISGLSYNPLLNKAYITKKTHANYMVNLIKNSD